MCRCCYSVRLWATAFVTLAILSVAGCSSSPEQKPYALFAPLDTVIFVPVSATPEGALRLFEWCHDSRNTAYYAMLLIVDFCFVFGANDPVGDPYRAIPWT